MSYRSKHRQQVHECSEPLCHVIVPINQRYCPVHKKQHEQAWQVKKDEYRKSKLARAIKSAKAKEYDQTERDPEATKFYHSKQWQKVRDYVYARDGATCQSCGNIVTDRKIVDHIVPRRLCSKEQALDTDNLWVLDYFCHYRKTRIEEAIAKQPNGPEKLRHLSKEWWQRTLAEEQGQTITIKEWREQHNDNK